jgi:hypothetical protein
MTQVWRTPTHRPLILLLAVTALSRPLCAQAPTLPAPGEGEGGRALAASWTDAPPAIDGRLDEPAWAAADTATGFLQIQPRPGAPASERTVARVLYDAGSLYVGVRMYDSAPDSIVARLVRRDEFIYSDWVLIGIDSYYDRRTAFAFGLNPRGVKMDFFLFNDTGSDPGWDAVWDGAARVDSLGWTAEFRIPLSQLRFDAGAEERVWGVNFQRVIARRDESSSWSRITQDMPGVVSRFRELRGLTRLAPARRFEVQPYSSGRLTRAPGDAADPFHAPNDVAFSAGADLEYGITPAVTLTATVNPDFGQVEADPAVVNLTAFETFYPEKRPFFLEGADIFRFGTGGEEQLFYSRRIGRSLQEAPPADAVFARTPEAATILGAVKLSGKTAGGWSIGVLDALTAPEEARYVLADGTRRTAGVEPLTNYGVLRVVRDFRGARSALGGIVTTTNRRLAEGEGLDLMHSAAYTAGVDGRHRFGGGDYELGGWIAGSYVQGSAEAIAFTQLQPGHAFHRPDAEHLAFDPRRTSLQGLAGDLGVARIGGNWRWNLRGTARSPGFETGDLGYQRQADLVTQSARAGYYQFREGRHFRRWSLELGERLGSTFGGERTETAASLAGTFQLRNYWEGYATLERSFAALSSTALWGGPALYTPGRSGVMVGMGTDPRRRLVAGLAAAADAEDGTGSRTWMVQPSLRVRPTPGVELSVGPSVSRNRNPWQYLDQRQVNGRTHYLLGRLDQTTVSLTTRLSYTLSPELSLQFYAEPFISAGAYDRFAETVEPRTAAFDRRFRRFAAGEAVRNPTEGTYAFDLDGDGALETGLPDPDFNVKQLRSNLVLRWEYRPGSTLFVVWNQNRNHFLPDGAFDIDRDPRELFGAPGTNVLLVKLSYWLAY